MNFYSAKLCEDCGQPIEMCRCSWGRPEWGRGDPPLWWMKKARDRWRRDVVEFMGSGEVLPHIRFRRWRQRRDDDVRIHP